MTNTDSNKASSDELCICACHDNKLPANTDGLRHDKVCCDDMNGQLEWYEVKNLINKKITEAEKRIESVDRFEVIDETGRAYVKGSTYGTPIKVELSYQDDGKTLKVFVKDRLATLKEGKN